MFTFYFGKGSCALATHIALEHVGAPYQVKLLDFSRNEQRSEQYLRINPKGRVPALVTPQGVLTETPALLQFIAQSYPHAGLAPLDDVFALAHMNAVNSFFCSTVHVAHAHAMRGARWADDANAIEAMKKKVPETVGANFELIEHSYLRGPWVLGERYSVSDMYLFTLARWLERDGVDIARFPKVNALVERMYKDPVVSKVLSAHAS